MEDENEQLNLKHQLRMSGTVAWSNKTDSGSIC